MREKRRDYMLLFYMIYIFSLFLLLSLSNFTRNVCRRKSRDNPISFLSNKIKKNNILNLVFYYSIIDAGIDDITKIRGSKRQFHHADETNHKIRVKKFKARF